MTEYEPMLNLFLCKHRPTDLDSELAEPFRQLGVYLVQKLPRSPERTVAIRKLLEAMDAALRAKDWKDLSALETKP
jgi:hypothetical protein